METSCLNSEETQVSFTKQADDNMIISKTESAGQSSKANSNTGAFLPHGFEDDFNFDEDLKVPITVRKFNFANPTLASEHKEKACLKNRLPDFTLTHKTLVSNTKFLEKTILPADKVMHRFRKARKIVYSEQGSGSKELPDIKPVRRSRSMIYPAPLRKAGSFAGFNLTQSEGHKIRKISYEQGSKLRKISNERKVSPPDLKEKNCWSEEICQGDTEEPVLMESGDLESSNDDVFHKQTTKLSKRRPIERFQKIVRLLCFLLKIKSSTDRKYKQQQHTVVFEQLEEIAETVVCNDDGMIFDPNYFKAIKEVKLSAEAVQILSMAPGTRTEEQLQAALVGLKASVAAFGEYPLKMQRRLVAVGWYESFEAKRVIIRQGHRAENFYFILSGTALVTLMLNDSATGEERSTTVAVLGKGSSFGELALLHHKTRSATVLCRNDVALLAVGREDFRDIFMSYEDGKEPEHVQFLRTVPYFKNLPLDQCATRPDLCIFHYFRRGVVIVKNSNTEWIYIIKSGSCRVLTNIARRKATFQNNTTKSTSTDIFSLPAIPVDEYERRKLLYTASGERMHSRPAWSPDAKRPRTEPKTKKEKESLCLPVIHTPPQEKFKKTVKKVNFALPWLERLNQEDVTAQAEVEAHRERIEKLHRKLSSAPANKSRTMSSSMDQNNNSKVDKTEHVCVQIELIKPKDQFGLASILYDNQAVNCHLVSNGAECILIKKSWFQQNADENFLRELRAQIAPYPTQDTLEQNLQDQANWQSFKSQTINDLLDTLRL